MGFVILLIFFLALVGVVLSPLGLVWSLNTLFGLSIAYTFKNWLAALVLLVLVTPKSMSTGKE